MNIPWSLCKLTITTGNGIQLCTSGLNVSKVQSSPWARKLAITWNALIPRLRLFALNMQVWQFFFFFISSLLSSKWEGSHNADGYGEEEDHCPITGVSRRHICWVVDSVCPELCQKKDSFAKEGDCYKRSWWELYHFIFCWHSYGHCR